MWLIMVICPLIFRTLMVVLSFWCFNKEDVGIIASDGMTCKIKSHLGRFLRQFLITLNI